MNDKLKQEIEKARKMEFQSNEQIKEELFSSDEVALLGMGLSLLAPYLTIQLANEKDEEKIKYYKDMLEDVETINLKLKRVLGI